MDVSPAKRSYFTCANVWWKLLFHSTIFCELNSSRHIQFHYYLISSEPDNFLSYHNLYGFHHLHTEYSCCLHIR